MSDLDDVKLTRARKLHSCEECNTLIPSARNYYRHKWLSEYGFRSIAVCVDCQHLAADMFTAGFVGENEDGNDCYPYLPEVDYWEDVRALGGDWPARVDAYLARFQTDEDRHGRWDKAAERYADGCREDRPHP